MKVTLIFIYIVYLRMKKIIRAENNLQAKYIEENCANKLYSQPIPQKNSLHEHHQNLSYTQLSKTRTFQHRPGFSHQVFIAPCAFIKNSPTTSAAASKQTSISAYTTSRHPRYRNPARGFEASRNSRSPDHARRILCTPDRKRGMGAMRRSTALVMM